MYGMIIKLGKKQQQKRENQNLLMEWIGVPTGEHCVQNISLAWSVFFRIYKSWELMHSSIEYLKEMQNEAMLHSYNYVDK